MVFFAAVPEWLVRRPLAGTAVTIGDDIKEPFSGERDAVLTRMYHIGTTVYIIQYDTVKSGVPNCTVEVDDARVDLAVCSDSIWIVVGGGAIDRTFVVGEFKFR